MKHLAAIVALFTLSTGCVTAKVELLSPNTYPPITPEEVTVFLSPDELEMDSIGYERVAMIFTQGSSEFTDSQGHLNKARKEAAKIGANGLVSQSSDPGGEYNWFWGTTSNRESSLMAIRWWIIPTEQRQRAEAADVAAQVSITPAADTLTIGERVQLRATACRPSGTAIPNKTFTWSSSNDAIASVSNAGLVTAHANGAVVIAANTDNVVGTAEIVVKAPGL